MIDKIRYLYVKNVYGDHNKSPNVKNHIKSIITNKKNRLILNIGAGKEDFKNDSKIVNLDIEKEESIHAVGNAHYLPFADCTFNAIISQEVIEHLEHPQIAVNEIFRALSPGGTAYIQVPFIIGYHPCPKDFWRFTEDSLKQLVTIAGFIDITIEQSVGPAVGFYRVLVEFSSVFFSIIHKRLYIPAKIVSSMLFFPIKWLDTLMKNSEEANRIAGGFIVTCKK